MTTPTAMATYKVTYKDSNGDNHAVELRARDAFTARCNVEELFEPTKVHSVLKTFQYDW